MLAVVPPVTSFHKKSALPAATESTDVLNVADVPRVPVSGTNTRKVLLVPAVIV